LSDYEGKIKATLFHCTLIPVELYLSYRQVTPENSMDFQQVKIRMQQYLPPEKIAVVEKAYEYAEKCHRGALRKSGQPYIEHPLKVADYLAEIQLDAASLEAALLHDVEEDCGVSTKEIINLFGEEVAKLVDGVTRLGKVSWSGEGSGQRDIQAQNLRKMLVAMAQDLRVVFIKLADRMHNMETLEYLAQDKQLENARETLEIYAPLAHRLGIWGLKWRLEDFSFKYLNPEEYKDIKDLVTVKRVTREDLVKHAKETLIQELNRAGIDAEVYGRPKHLYSIYQKRQRYELIGKKFDDIHDLVALRVLVSTIPECYTALGIIHNLWRPISDEFDDYIANPKPNGYQSLHTSVIYEEKPLEVQIRTFEMHEVAEKGFAAHWLYKEDQKYIPHVEEKIDWLRQLVEWHQELKEAEEFMESVKTDLFIDQVFVMTPKGEIKDLPKGATPLDFAYRIHTELGHRCIGARVNQRMVPLNYELKNGDVVEILTTHKSKGPSRDWLSPHLGYTRTSHARQKIRQWFAKQERTENIEHGRELLDKELRHLGIRLSERDKLAELFKYNNLEDFLEALGEGIIGTQQVAHQLAEVEKETPERKVEAVEPKISGSGIKVLGSENLATRLAQCCHPVPGDSIIGYVTRNRGVTIHCQDCYNVIHEDEKERLIPVEWGKTDTLYPVKIQVEAQDRVGLMRDISALVADEKVNISSINLINHDNNTVTLYFTLGTRGLEQLSRLLAKTESIRGVISVARVGEDTKKP